MTQPWGLEVDRVELTIGSLLKAPEENPSGSGSLNIPPSVPGMEGLAGPIQQLAMHFLNRTGSSHPQQGLAPEPKTLYKLLLYNMYPYNDGVQ